MIPDVHVHVPVLASNRHLVEGQKGIRGVDTTHEFSVLSYYGRSVHFL